MKNMPILPFASAAFVAPSAAKGVACGAIGAAFIPRVSAWIVRLISIAGGPAVGFATFIESLFPPIASEAILPLAGFDAARGTVSLVEAVIWATIGSMFGAWVVYALGRMIGKERMLELAADTPGFSRSRSAAFHAGFEKASAWLVSFGRFIPVVRSAMSFEAGVIRMNFLRFTNLSLLCSLVWNAFLIVVGMLLNAHPCALLQLVSIVEIIVIVICIAALVAVGVIFLRGWRSQKSAQEK